jgi:hypothetical protein
MNTPAKPKPAQANHSALLRVLAVLLVCSVAHANDLNQLLRTHAANKERVLRQLQETPQLALTRSLGMDFREAWRHILIDGPCGGVDKLAFFQTALGQTEAMPIRKGLEALLASHRQLFSAGQNGTLMVRYAGDAAFVPFGRHMTLAAALATMTAGDDAEVQAFQTIFETGQNTRGHVHKLESHGQAIEFIYAVTDIVYGVMLPTELDYQSEKVIAEPGKVQMFYIKTGEVIALHPYVLHSGSLSVEPDRSFSIVIYKQPVSEGVKRAVKLPGAWESARDLLKLPGIDKFYLTLDEFHTDDLRNNHGYIAGKRPIRLPTWQ